MPGTTICHLSLLIGAMGSWTRWSLRCLRPEGISGGAKSSSLLGIFFTPLPFRAPQPRTLSAPIKEQGREGSAFLFQRMRGDVRGEVRG